MKKLFILIFLILFSSMGFSQDLVLPWLRVISYIQSDSFYTRAAKVTSTLELDGEVSGDFSVDSPTFVVDSDNNRVGIGIAAPTTLLEMIAGNSDNAVFTIGTSPSFYQIWRNNTTGILSFKGSQPGYTGFDFISDDASYLLRLEDDGDIIVGNILPASDESADLGSSSYKFNLIYADTMHASHFGGLSDFTIGSSGENVTISADTIKGTPIFSEAIEISGEPTFNVVTEIDTITTLNVIGSDLDLDGSLTIQDSLNIDGSKFVFSPVQDSTYTVDLKVDGTATLDAVVSSGNIAGTTYGSDGSISDAELLTLDDGATTQILVGGGAGSAPVWGTDIPTAVTIGSGYIYRAGGTDVADADVADDITLTDISQITTKPITSLSATNWRIFYSADGAVPVELALGANGTFLESNGASASPAFRALEAGDIPDISATYQPLSATLTSISGLSEADVSILETTADNTYNVVTSGGNNYILGSTSDNSSLEFKAPTGSGSPVLATSPTLTTSISVASGFSIDVTGTGNSYLEVIQDNNAGYLAVGRTTGSESSQLSICDGGSDNEPGFLVLFEDDGNGSYLWVNSASQLRCANSVPADDDAGGYAIIDLTSGAIGASGVSVAGLTITAAGNTFNLTQGTSSLDVAAAKTVDIDQDLTIDGTGLTITGVTQANTITLNESFTIGDGNTGTLTYSAASKTLTVEDNTTVGLDLNALEGLSSTGLVSRTAANTYSERTITGTANEITVSNGDGVSGNPTLSLPDAITLGTNAGTSGGIDFVASDNDQGDVDISTDDELEFSNFSGGYQFDAQLHGNIEYDKINVSLDAASSMTADTLWFFENDFQAAMTLDSIRVRATTDDQDVNVIKSARNGGTIAVVDAITASTDGTGEVYYATETTLTTSSIAAGEYLGMTKPSITSDNIVISIYYHVTKQKR